MRINLKHLKTFVAIARAGSFTRAAEQIRISQPALTVTIQQLEEDLGVLLFERSSRHLRLTPEGDELFGAAQKLIHDFDSTISGIKQRAQHRRSQIRVASFPSVSMRLLSSAIPEFCARHPKMDVHVLNADAGTLHKSVKSGESDLGFGTVWYADDSLQATPLLRDPFGVVLRSDHPLASDDSPLRWSDLEGATFFASGPRDGWWSQLDNVSGLPTFILRPSYVATHALTIEAMLEAGMGVTIMPFLAAPPGRQRELRFRRLIKPTLDREISLMTRRGETLPPLVDRFRQQASRALRAYAQENGLSTSATQAAA